MKFERVAAAAIAVGVLGMAAILVFGPRTDAAVAHAGAEASRSRSLPASLQPILQPVTPAGYPYSSLAILRSQRLATDVLTLSDSSEQQYQTETARRLFSIGKSGVWIVLDNRGNVCIVESDRTGLISSCDTGSPVERHPEPGSPLISGGFGGGKVNVAFTVLADGTPVAGSIGKGLRQIAPNVWVKARGMTAVARPAVDGDPQSFPVGEPYASMAILRRPATKADVLPPSWYATDGSAAPVASVILSTVRLATTVGKDRVWVGASTDGGVCLVADSGGSFVTGCGTIDGSKRQTLFGVGLGNNGDEGNIDLVVDGVTARELPSGEHFGGLNVAVSPPTS